MNTAIKSAIVVTVLALVLVYAVRRGMHSHPASTVSSNLQIAKPEHRQDRATKEAAAAKPQLPKADNELVVKPNDPRFKGLIYFVPGHQPIYKTQLEYHLLYNNTLNLSKAQIKAIQQAYSKMVEQRFVI